MNIEKIGRGVHHPKPQTENEKIMGYTHYWHREADLTAGWDLFTSVLQSGWGSGGVMDSDIICEEHDKPDLPPVINIDEVRFNGRGRDGGHETFQIKRIAIPRVDENPRQIFSFCKTAQKPYDAVVVRVLMLAEECFGNAITVESDGDWAEVKQTATNTTKKGGQHMAATQTQPTTETYKGHELLVLNPDQKYPMKFGLAKAKLVIEHLDAVQSFIEESEGKASA